MDHLGVKTEIDRLVNELNHHNQLYYIQNNPIISDIEFDQLLKKLEQLEKEGVKVYPTPAAIRIIKNKILQKQFYQANDIPTSPFVVTENLAALQQQSDFLPDCFWHHALLL